MADADFKLISGEFIIERLPPDKEWLSNYFESETVYHFLVYCLIFKEIRQKVSLRNLCGLFVDHSGHYCSMQFLARSHLKMVILEDSLEKAYKDKDLETISVIKSGMFFKNKHI